MPTTQSDDIRLARFSALWYVDADSDTYGDLFDDGQLPGCPAPDGVVQNHSDCDDADSSIHPGAIEICDGADNDCDGDIDAADLGLVTVSCENQNGVCSDAQKPAALCSGGTWGTCTASDYALHSASYEDNETSCDGLDNDCDNLVDEGCA